MRLSGELLTTQVGLDVYYTDDVSAEPNFQAQQKILTGSMPTTVVRNRIGDQIFVAEGGSDMATVTTLAT